MLENTDYCCLVCNAFEVDVDKCSCEGRRDGVCDVCPYTQRLSEWGE